MALTLFGIAETGLPASGVGAATFVRRRRSDGAYWNTSGTPAFEAYSGAHVANYGIASAETAAGTGQYTAADPAPTVEGDYLLVKQAGASLAASDLAAARWQDQAGPNSADVEQWLGAVAAALPTNFGSFAITAAGGVTLANGVNHGGGTATLQLGANGITAPLRINNGGGDAVQMFATNGDGINVQGADGVHIVSSGGVDINLGGSGSIAGNLTGKVLGSTATAITGVGVWAAGAGGSAVMLASSYTVPPTTAQIATAVLTDTGDNTTVGSLGKIAAQLGGTFTTTSSSVFSAASLVNVPTGGTITVGGYASGQDPATLVLGALTSTYSTVGTVGYDIGLIPTIYSRTASATITITSLTTTSGSVTIYAGDDYFAADGRQIAWSSAGWPNLTAGAVSITLYATTTGTAALTQAMTISVAGAGTQTVQLELSAAQTTLLGAASEYFFAVAATLNDAHSVTLVTGAFSIKARNFP